MLRSTDNMYPNIFIIEETKEGIGDYQKRLGTDKIKN